MAKSIIRVRTILQRILLIRGVIAGHKELARKISQLERKISGHNDQILVMIEAIKQLMNPKLPPKQRRIGFQSD